MLLRGRWADGIPPRNFAWIIKDQLAISERPGGQSRNHRPVRRQEEILWLRSQGFTRMVSLLGSPHNLRAYEQLGMAWSQVPFSANSEVRTSLVDLYAQLRQLSEADEHVLVHEEELSDQLMGAMAGYLLWSKKLASGAQAISILEQMVGRQMGSVGRELVALVPEL